MDIESLVAKHRADRIARGLLSAQGVACASVEEKAYRDFRHEMAQRSDWGRLPADLELKLVSLKNQYRASRL